MTITEQLVLAPDRDEVTVAPVTRHVDNVVSRRSRGRCVGVTATDGRFKLLHVAKGAISCREQVQQTSDRELLGMPFIAPARYRINFAQAAKNKSKPHTATNNTSPIAISPQFRLRP